MLLEKKKKKTDRNGEVWRRLTELAVRAKMKNVLKIDKDVAVKTDRNGKMWRKLTELGERQAVTQ